MNTDTSSVHFIHIAQTYQFRIFSSIWLNIFCHRTFKIMKNTVAAQYKKETRNNFTLKEGEAWISYNDFFCLIAIYFGGSHVTCSGSSFNYHHCFTFDIVAQLRITYISWARLPRAYEYIAFILFYSTKFRLPEAYRMNVKNPLVRSLHMKYLSHI